MEEEEKIIPEFQSSANHVFPFPPQEFQKLTYPSLQTHRRAEMVDDNGKQSRNEDFTVLLASFGGPPSQAELRPILNFHG